MASENSIQNFIHNLEQGSMQNIIKAAVIGGLIVILFILYFGYHFCGFANEHAMDQAQIARSLASGQGFSTKIIRPLALWKLYDAEKPIPTEKFPDFYNAPLNPIVNALPLLLIKSKWNKPYPRDGTYIGDRVIAVVSILFFLASVGVGFFIARHLFDSELALLGCACVLVTDLLWEFSLSGLPQMLMLFFFVLTCWFIICAQQAATEEKAPTLFLNLVMAALTLGLLTLAHGLGFWLFLGYIIFAGIYFRPRSLAVGLSILVYLLTISPWLIYNYKVCGNPLGIGCYVGLSFGKEELLMRSLSPHVNDWMMSIRAKIRMGFLGQFGNLFGNLGLNFAALGFFFALLHPFKRTETAQFRWCVLLMWFFAIIGMTVFGSDSSKVLESDQLNVLFIPIMVFYGLAFILVLWHRLEISGSLYRLIFLIFIPVLCAGPMLLRLVGGQQSTVSWPPYYPPLISILSQWTSPEEIIASDVPWAVAWYAQRKSLLLPDTVKSFNEINDYRLLGGPIIGIYMTPVSGDRRFISEIMKGPYKEWGPFITHSLNFKGLPFRAAAPMMDNEVIFYADRERWKKDSE
ncbi:MAG: hypothetical protein ABI443_10390 [Chthoniobacterales bacterium]